MLATDTLARFTTATSALTAPTETPVVRNPTYEESRRSGSPFDMMLYVVRIATGDERYGDVVGTVQTVTPSPSRDGWFRRNEDGNLQRLYGAPLNTGMVNGRYYRSLDGGGVLVRYNDDDHAGDRNIASLPLSIIATNGGPWPIPDDGTLMWDYNVPYIEVEAPATPVVVTPPPAVELTDAHQFVEDITVNGPTRGFAVVEADGRVMLDPPLVVGEQYIYWSEPTDRQPWGQGAMSECRIITALGENGGDPTFSNLGYWTMERVDGANVPYFYTGRRTVLDSERPKHWAKLALTTPEPTNTDATPFMNRMSVEAELFREFNEATNTLAENNDWCSEYEGIVEKLGMEGRTDKVRDWDVEVSVDFSFEADSVPGRIDTEVANTYNIPGISLNSARFTGTARVTVRVCEQRSEDAVRDYIDSDEVYEALDNMMSGVSSIEVDDYDIRDITEVD